VIAKNPCTFTDSGVTGFGCSPSQSSRVNTVAGLDTEVQVYLLALDIPPAQGVAKIEAGLVYNSAPNQGVDVLSWTLCADQGVDLNGWPDSGSGMEFGFPSCGGTVPDPDDPEGDAGVLLGAFTVIAHSNDVLKVHDLDYRFSPPLRYTDCSGKQSYLLVGNYGRVAFSSGTGYGYDPCGSIVDYNPGTCCYPDGSTGPVWSYICCEAAGGVFIAIGNPQTCATPVERDTWGRLKARYRD
jgi:hypothetical protein